MKKLLLLAIIIGFGLEAFAQNNLPGPVKVRKAGKYILLDVTDSTMVDFNNQIKLYQTGDTLYLLTKTHQVLAKFAPDTVYFITGIGIGGSNIGDTLIFSDGSEIRLGTNAIELFSYNSGGRTVQVYDLDNLATLSASRIYLNTTDTTDAIYPGMIAYKSDGNYYSYNGVLEKWEQINGGGGGSGSGTVTTDLNQIAVGSGTDAVGGSSKFTTSANGDTIKIDNSTHGAIFKLPVDNGTSYSYFSFKVKNSANAFNINSDYLSTGNSNSWRLLNSTPSSTNPNLIPRGDATTTGVGSYGIGYLSLIAVGSEEVRISSSRIILYDSTELGFVPKVNRTRYSGISHTGSFYPDSTSNQGFMLSYSPFPSIDEYWKDQQPVWNSSIKGYENELAYYYRDRKEIKKTYGIEHLSLGLQIGALMSAREMDLRFIIQLKEKTEKIDVLENELRKANSDLDDLKDRMSKLEQAFIKLSAQ